MLRIVKYLGIKEDGTSEVFTEVGLAEEFIGAEGVIVTLEKTPDTIELSHLYGLESYAIAEIDDRRTIDTDIEYIVEHIGSDYAATKIEQPCAIRVELEHEYTDIESDWLESLEAVDAFIKEKMSYDYEHLKIKLTVVGMETDSYATFDYGVQDELRTIIIPTHAVREDALLDRIVRAYLTLDEDSQELLDRHLETTFALRDEQ